MSCPEKTPVGRIARLLSAQYVRDPCNANVAMYIWLRQYGLECHTNLVAPVRGSNVILSSARIYFIPYICSYDTTLACDRVENGVVNYKDLQTAQLEAMLNKGKREAEEASRIGR